MLLSVSDIRLARDISQNIPNDRVEPYIEQVENLLILPVLGAELFERLSVGRNSDTLCDEERLLLDGGYYTDGGGVRCHLAGLLRAEAYLVYSKLVLNNQLNVTAFGVRQKSGDFSVEADWGQVERASNEAYEVGMRYLDELRGYLGMRAAVDDGSSVSRWRVI